MAGGGDAEQGIHGLYKLTGGLHVSFLRIYPNAAQISYTTSVHPQTQITRLNELAVDGAREAR